MYITEEDTGQDVDLKKACLPAQDSSPSLFSLICISFLSVSEKQ